ncbi:MAG TPA: TonB-dependent receptor [Opitutaceae bacterium]|nr:TonB-dependent receptor [Opitutaceae bacterium]
MHRSSLPSAFPRLVLCGVLAATLESFAQTAPTPATAPATSAASAPTDAESTVVLSPFEVNAARDYGYTATSALAGGRTNTALKDTPAAISVFTRQFLDDINATDFRTAAEWAVNAIPDYNSNQSPFGDYAINLRGLGSSYPSRNYFLWYIDGDSYNTDRFEFARGPNGVLFGDGNIGGVTTTWTKRAQTDRAFRRVEGRADTYGGYRVSADINQPISENFALRFDSLYDRGMGWRDGSANIRTGDYLTGTWRVDERTNFTFEVEIGRRDTNVYPTNYIDASSNWDGTIPNGTKPPQSSGLSAVGTYYLYIPAVPQAGYTNWAGTYVMSGSGVALQPDPRSDIPRIVGLPSREFNLQPPDSRVGLKYYTYSAFLDHRFGDNLYAQIAYNRSRNQRESFGSETLLQEYRIDVNKTLPNGQPNPKFGVPYTDTQRNTQNQSNLVDDLRGLVTYGFDVKGWNQRISLIGGERRDLFDYWQKRLFRTNGTNPNFGASDNQYRERRYWDEPGSYDFGGPPILPGYTFDYEPTFLLHQRKFLDYVQLASTSKFFNDRLTVILGVRYDHFHQTQKSSSGIAPDPVTGLPRLGGVIYQPGKAPVGVVGGKTVTDVSPVSKNAGAVYFLNNWLGVYGNYSQTFAPPGAGESLIDGQPPGISRSEGYDAGFKLELLGGKISGTIDYYDTRQTDRLDFRNTRQTEINRIWSNLGRNELATVAYRDTQTYDGTGYEFDFTANVTRNLAILFNFALPETKALNLRPGLNAYYNEHIAEWKAAAADANNPAHQQIQADIDAIASDLSGAVPGVTLNNTYKYTGNIYATYTFNNGALKGFQVGAGGNFRGRSKIGNTLTSPFDYVYGDSYAVYSAHIGYSHRFGRVTNRFQLNVSNLFDEDKLIYTGTQDYRVGGLSSNPLIRVPSAFRYIDPRRITFTTSFDF